jgi:hypothetical protein
MRPTFIFYAITALFTGALFFIGCNKADKSGSSLIRNYSFPREYLSGDLRRLAEENKPTLSPGATPEQVREWQKLQEQTEEIQNKLKEGIAGIFDPVRAELLKRQQSEKAKQDQGFSFAVDAALSDVAKCRAFAEFGVPHVEDGKVHTLLFTLRAMQDWNKGMMSYGVLYDPGRDYWPIQTLEAKDSIPINLRQVNGGDWKGVFEDSKGNLFVPGLRYFSELSETSR